MFYFVPEISHCGSGPGLDQFGLLSAMGGLGKKGRSPEIRYGNRQSLPWTEPPAMPLSQARRLYETG